MSKVVPRMDKDGLDLLEKMLQPNPLKRITANEALQHAYFSDLPKEVLQLYKGK